ncbi:DNA-directed RNA polymerases I, II, and III subunit RPABC1-like isoform X2 [Artemia franciscana]|uniref:DNA-directed RNA polymerases I, II, and III subunit RPABC1-like isoform X2 n=1 Tax=Artemia franciscana TaxID=6661 RepID=UPI0032DB8B7B
MTNLKLSSFGVLGRQSLNEGRPSWTDLSFFVSHRDNPNDEMYICFSDEPANLRTFTRLSNILQDENALRRGGQTSRVIVVVQRGPTRSKKEIGGIIFECFKELELFTINDDALVLEKHVILTPSEEELDMLDEENIPRIHSDDFAARYFGLERGQVVKIVRPSGLCVPPHICTCRPYMSYRLVV